MCDVTLTHRGEFGSLQYVLPSLGICKTCSTSKLGFRVLGFWGLGFWSLGFRVFCIIDSVLKDSA